MSPEVGVLTSNPRPVSCFHFAQGTAPCSFSWKITCRLVNWKTKLKQFYFYFSDWAGKSNIRTFWIEVSLFCLSWMSKKQAHVIQTQHEPNKTQSGLSLHSHLWSGQIKPQFTKWKVWILQLSLSHPRQPVLSCLAIADVKVLVRGLISTTYCIPRWTDLSKSWRLRSIPVWFPAAFPLMSGRWTQRTWSPSPFSTPPVIRVSTRPKTIFFYPRLLWYHFKSICVQHTLNTL